MSTNTAFIRPPAFVPELAGSNNQQVDQVECSDPDYRIRARAMAVIARFEANRDLIWKQDSATLSELLQQQILARAVLDRL